MLLSEEDKKQVMDSVITEFKQNLKSRILQKLLADNVERVDNYIQQANAELQPEIKKLMPI